jgi:hypothetical protein
VKATATATVPVKKTSLPAKAGPPAKATAPVKKAAPATVAEPEDETEETTNGKTRTGKNIGRTSGMRVMQYQDKTMSQQAKRKLTDEELGQDWSNEFPEARCQFKDRMDIVRVVRKLYNEKRHGQQSIFDGIPVAKYEVNEHGKRVPVAEELRTRGGNRKKAVEVADEEESDE